MRDDEQRLENESDRKYTKRISGQLGGPSIECASLEQQPHDRLGAQNNRDRGGHEDRREDPDRA